MQMGNNNNYNKCNNYNHKIDNTNKDNKSNIYKDNAKIKIIKMGRI